MCGSLAPFRTDHVYLLRALRPALSLPWQPLVQDMAAALVETRCYRDAAPPRSPKLVSMGTQEFLPRDVVVAPVAHQSSVTPPQVKLKRRKRRTKRAGRICNQRGFLTPANRPTSVPSVDASSLSPASAPSSSPPPSSSSSSLSSTALRIPGAVKGAPGKS